MTSNLGAKEIQAYEQRSSKGWRRMIPQGLLPSIDSRRKHIRELVDVAMQKKFDPEFINRLDQILLFNRIEKSELKTLIEIEKLNLRLMRRGWQLRVTSQAAQWLTQFYDPGFGARSIRRACRQHLELAIANFLLQPDGEESSGDLRLAECVTEVDVYDDKLTAIEKKSIAIAQK